MTPFEFAIVGLLCDAPTPLYSMYWSVNRAFGGLVSMTSFLALVDELLSERSGSCGKASTTPGVAGS